MDHGPHHGLPGARRSGPGGHIRSESHRDDAAQAGPPAAAAHRRLVLEFLAAAQTGELAGLEALLAADVIR
ncbi:MAG TPA: hypothetical protein VES42_15855 [Pilimelia sp.]|nr:hypothetical protein [Pilimelia sp.]